MRFIIEAKIPVENGNNKITNNSLTGIISAYLTDIKPEAAYFVLKNGQRTIFAIINLEAAHKLPATLEPLWLDLNCDIQMYPTMVFEDLQKAGPDLESILKKRK